MSVPEVLLELLLAALVFAFGYYVGMQAPPTYDTETLFDTGLQDGRMTVYRGDASAMPIAVAIRDQTADSLHATVTVEGSGATYGLRVYTRQATVTDAAGAPLASTVWDDATTRVSLLDAAGDTVLSNPLGGKLTLRTADHAAVPPDALALLDGDVVQAVLEEAGNYTLYNRHRTIPVVLLTEINDVPEAAARVITTTMVEGTLNRVELVEYHHTVLNHSIPREFFEGHKTIIAEMTEWLRQQEVDGEPIALPFGRYPYWDPGQPVAAAFTSRAAVADSLFAAYPMCSRDFPPRIGVPEEYFLINQPSPEITHRWPCDPAEQATWCQTRLICDGEDDESADAVNPIDACDDDPEMFPPGTCPFSVVPRLQPDNVCAFTNLQALWGYVIDWHGDVHIRTGGATGMHPTTVTTPAFWAFHQQIDAIYDNWSQCDGRQ